MELEMLISEICGKVQERLAALEQEGTAAAVKTAEDDGKPGLLLIAQEHGELCHPTLESKELNECYRVDCMLLQNEQCDLKSYEGVIAYTLTNEALGKIANGIFDTDYTKAFGTALLLGKRIFIAEEEVELYRYKDTAPAGYYSRLSENLKFLENNGVTIVPNSTLAETILGGQAVCAASKPEKKCCPEKPEEKTVYLSKRVITERDMVAAREEKATCVAVTSKAILTDLAKEYGRRYGISFQRENAAETGKGASGK